MKTQHLILTILSALPLTFWMQSASSEERSPLDKSDAYVYKAQNPLTPMFSLPMKYTYHGGAGTGGVNIGSLQPIMPVQFENWNLINQLTLNVIATPGPVNGIAELPEPFPGDGVTGLADTTFTSYLSPADSRTVSWGIGPTFVFPTDTLFSDTEDRRSRELGSGKFSVGPAFMIVTQPKPWSLGLSVKQVWSVIGSDSRESVSQMVLQPTINYNLADDWYLVSDMDMIANWNRDQDQRWTVPVGAGIGKLIKIGDDYALNTKIEGYYNPVRPDNAPEWSANLTLQLFFGE